MSDVFISYKAEDRRRIQPLVQALQADGYSVWWDEHIGTGDAWRQTIEKQLDSARLTLLGKTAEAKQAYSLVPPDNV
jgi:serine/threonine-protein kinase